MEVMETTGRAVPTLTFYDAVGGEPTFRRLVSRFYEGVAADPPLRALYPEEDLTDAQDRLTLFLMQYWGGPHTYSETRGHPRLRMRHGPFAVTPDMRDRWLRHMRDATHSGVTASGDSRFAATSSAMLRAACAMSQRPP